MDRYKYTRITLNVFPHNIIDQYNLNENIETVSFIQKLDVVFTAYLKQAAS